MCSGPSTKPSAEAMPHKAELIDESFDVADDDVDDDRSLACAQ